MTGATPSIALVRRNIGLLHKLKALAGLLALRTGHRNSQEAARLLDQSWGGWQLDAVALCGATADRPLSTLAVYLIGRLGFVSELGLDQRKVERFFGEIERGYPTANAYHNRAHAASVVHFMFALLEHAGLHDSASLALSGSEGGLRSVHLGIMACLFAAAIHDFEHEGVTNDFMVKTHHARAAQHRNLHVNEQHHVAAAFEVFARPENNFLAHLPAGDLSRFRSMVNDLVLATDMADNRMILEAFVSRLEAMAAAGQQTGMGEPIRTGTFVPKTAEDARLLLRMAMKCADLSHLTLGWEAHMHWVQGLEAEFFRQGDLEKEAGLPVSFLMDRCKPGISVSQVGFMDSVALPLFQALAQAVPATEPALAGVTRNAMRWQELAAAQASEREACTGKEEALHGRGC